MTEQPQPKIGESPFPVLTSILLAYFREGDEERFYDLYRRRGEDSAEFSGLSDEIMAAIRQPEAAAEVVNSALGTHLDAMGAREALAGMHDRMKATGAFSEEEVARQSEADRPLEAERIASSWLTRPISLPTQLGGVSRWEFPIWVVPVVGLALAAVGLGLGDLPLPSFLDWIPALLLLAGLAVVGVSAATMVFLRDDLVGGRRRQRRRERRASGQAPRLWPF